jgi:enediyne biosynthesis protein E4
MSTTVRPAPTRPGHNSPHGANGPGPGGRRSRQGPTWKRDPRIPFAAILTAYVVMGTLWLGFNRSPSQILTIVAVGCALDMGLHALLRKRELLVPLSAYISSLSIAILLNFAHDPWLLFLPIFLTIASKYVFTFESVHRFNPSLFGVATTLLIAGHVISAAPAYQWGGSLAISAFIVTTALALFVFRIGRGWLIGSFLVFYALQTALRAWIMRAHLPPEMLFLGTMTSPPFYLFTFFMITDPKTSPTTPRAQVMLALAITLVDLYLHKLQSVFTFFYAAFAVAWARFLWLHARAMWRRGIAGYLRAHLFTPARLRVVAVIGALAVTGGSTYRAFHRHVTLRDVGFTLREVPPIGSGVIITMDPTALALVDPRLRHIAKWLLSVGASVASADVDNDGLVDLFFTSPLARPEDRVVLFRNLGAFRFARIPIPALDALRGPAAANGLPGGALFVDVDNDGDQDLLVDVSFGRAKLLRNEQAETGRLAFTDVSATSGVDQYVISVSANALDYDRDGFPDLLVGNVLAPLLDGYRDATRLNIFRLPQPEFRGDRRMFRFMHNGWHNADNGGRNVLLHNRGDGTFAPVDVAAVGMPETHWTIAIGTGDLNGDGWTDLYLASDFGRDDLYLNEGGTRWRRVAGRMFGDVGMDTYKGMNSSIADFDGNGALDVYVSNVHHALQAEGSILWMNHGARPDGTPILRDEASQHGALNEDRFGWGAGVGDLANRGWIDIVQANGMVDDRFDRIAPGCPDYWYVNHKLMQSTREIHTYADMWGDIRGRCIYPNERRRVYFNRGAGARPQFVDVAEQVGLTAGDNSRGVALVDLDNDGRLDVVIANQHAGPAIFRNAATPAGAANAWVGVRLVGDGTRCSRDALGSTVTVTDRNGRAQVREVQAANGFASQHDTRVHFGLGSEPGDSVDLRVRWCGAEQRVYRVARNHYHRITQ